MRFEYAPGATPIDPDEAKGLIPAHLTLQRELNESCARYIAALQAADAGDCQPLLDFLGMRDYPTAYQRGAQRHSNCRFKSGRR